MIEIIKTTVAGLRGPGLSADDLATINAAEQAAADSASTALSAANAAQGWGNFRAVMADAIADFPVGTYFVSIDTGGVTDHPNEARLYQRIEAAPNYQDQGDAAAPLTKPELDLIFDGQVTAKQYGLKGDGATDDQAASLALMATPFKTIRFTPGVYKCGVANSVSNRTFVFDEGAIIDGTFHLAVGSGPDTNPGFTEITWVENITVVGTITTTTRVGTYYCRKIFIPKIRITEIDPAYTGQTAAGGSNGVHLYVGTKDLYCGEIVCDSATDGVYALGIDVASTTNVGGDFAPENIHIGRLVVHNSTQSIISTNGTVNVTIDEVIADSWDTYGAMSLAADTNLRIGKITAIAATAPTVANKDGIYVLNGISASFGEVEIAGATEIGFRTFNCGRVDAGTIRAHGNATDQVRIESPGRIDRIVTSGGGSGVGVTIQGNATGLSVGEINDNGGGGITVAANDVIISRIVSTANPAKYGLWLNNCARFYNQYLRVDGNSQGLRMTTVTDPTFGAMRISNNTNGIVASAVTGLAYGSVSYSGNGADTNLTLNGVASFRTSGIASDTAANIASAAATINTTAKFLTKQVWDTTNHRMMVSTGSLATSPWYVADGSVSVVPA